MNYSPLAALCGLFLLTGCGILNPYKALDEAREAMTPLEYVDATVQTVGVLARRTGSAEQRGLISERIEEQVLDKLQSALNAAGAVTLAMQAGESVNVDDRAHDIRGYLQAARDFLRTHGLLVQPNEPLIQ